MRGGTNGMWIALAAAVCATSPCAAADSTRGLLTIDGLSLPAGQVITSFEIQTWGVDILAICRLPRSWEIKSARYNNSEALLTGEADVHADRLSSLDALFLVDVYGYRAETRDDVPASFAGDIGFSDQTSLPDKQRRKLAARNFRLTTAERCPDPPPLAED